MIERGSRCQRVETQTGSTDTGRGHQDRDSPNRPRGRNRADAEQVLLDRVAEGETDQRSGDERDEQLQQQPSPRVVAAG